MSGMDQPKHEEAAGRHGAPAPDARLLNRIMELYALTEGARSRSDTESFGLVLERMAYGADVAERAELAERLALAPDAPVRLMRRLAFDAILVARPVLQYSPRLSEKDLTVLASKLEREHLLAIAHRLALSAAVTDILVERGDSRVLSTVLHNCGAAFSAAGRARLAERAEAEPELRPALRLRPELAPGLIDRVKRLIAGPPPAAAAVPDAKTQTPAAGPARGRAEETGEPETDGTGGESETAIGAPQADAAAQKAAFSEWDFSDEAVFGGAVPEEEAAPEEDAFAGAFADEIAAGAAAAEASPAGESTVGNGEDDARDAGGGDASSDEQQWGHASERNLVAVARAGLVPDTVASLARLTRQEESIARHCLLRAELSALMVLCKAGAFANPTFTALLKLRAANSGESIDMVTMLRRYEAMKPHTARRIIQLADKKKHGAAAAAAE